MKQRYPTYKSSGVEWIGEIPEGWECRLGTTIGDFFKGKGIRKDEVIESGNPCIRYGEIYTKYNHKVESVCSFISDDVASNSIKVNGSHILLTGSGELASEIGKAIIVNLDEVYIGGDIIILQTGRDFDPYYLTYLINSESVRIQRELAAKGEIVVHIYSKNFREMKFCCPSLHEQQQIATYLDDKTTLIDQIISGSEKKLEILKEHRTATINHAVTKGLNPKVKMKDSEVEWIGEIPVGWELGRFNYYICIRHGYQFRDYDFTENGIKVVKITQLHKDGYLDLSNCSFIDETRLSSFEDIVIQESDILMCLTGGTIGKIIRVGRVSEPLVQNYRVGHFSSKNEEVILNDYLFLLMTSNVVIGQIFYEIRETGQPNIGIEDFRKMKITVPPIQEQQQIVTFLDQKTKEIDDLISSEQKRIELMKEYRQSLISEAVTGKIKVANG